MTRLMSENWNAVYAIAAYLVGVLMGIGFWREREVRALARRTKQLELERRIVERESGVEQAEQVLLELGVRG